MKIKPSPPTKNDVVTMYTKPNCPYCDRAKEIFEDLSVWYDERTIQQYLDEFGFDKATAPRIVINGILLGGCSELLETLRNE